MILDAGSGLRPLGHELMSRRSRSARRRHAAVAHPLGPHSGLPFFKPLSAPGNSVCIYGAAQEGVPLEEILRRQMDPMVFPVPLTRGRRDRAGHRDRGGRVRHGGFRRARLPAPASRHDLGYRLAPEPGGREIAYVTDNELDGRGERTR